MIVGPESETTHTNCRPASMVFQMMAPLEEQVKADLAKFHKLQREVET